MCPSCAAELTEYVAAHRYNFVRLLQALLLPKLWLTQSKHRQFFWSLFSLCYSAWTVPISGSERLAQLLERTDTPFIYTARIELSLCLTDCDLRGRTRTLEVGLTWRLAHRLMMMTFFRCGVIAFNHKERLWGGLQRENRLLKEGLLLVW